MSSVRRSAAPSPAYVLHRYDWSETSLIIDLFTRDQGRVTVAAKGAKRPYSQLRPVLLPFQRLLASFSRPARDEQAEVFTLRGAEWAGGAPMLSGAALFSGFYLNELLMKLLARGDPHPLLFDAYAGTLPALAAEQETLTQAALRAFELVLLREIGLLPQLDRDTSTQQPVKPDAAYVLRPELGVARLTQGERPPTRSSASGPPKGTKNLGSGSSSPDERPQTCRSASGPPRGMRNLGSGPSFPHEASLDGARLLSLQRLLDRGSLGELQRSCAESLPALRAMLRPVLHYHLGTPRLRTREVMIEAQQMMDAPSPRAGPANLRPNRPEYPPEHPPEHLPESAPGETPRDLP